LLAAIACATLLAVPGYGAPTRKGTGAKAAKPVKSTPSQHSDLNTASLKDLEGLPGVGAATAKKIIAGRPYSSAEDLSKAGIPAKTITAITPMITVSPMAVAPAAASASAASASAVSPAPAAKASSKAASKPIAPPPAPGMVWVNLDTKVYHKEGQRWFGNTKNGKYMTEADAMKAGYRTSKE
jgi:hypothetical protein